MLIHKIKQIPYFVYIAGLSAPGYIVFNIPELVLNIPELLAINYFFNSHFKKVTVKL